MIKNLIKTKIKKAINLIFEEKIWPQFEIPEIEVFYPPPNQGDYSTNLAFLLAKVLNRQPLEIARDLKSKLEDPQIFEKIEVGGGGFINFFLSLEFLQNQILEILKKDYGKLDFGRGKKVSIESISANPTGPLHIGNGRNAFSGDVLANVLERAGYKVTREYFINDAKVNTQIKLLGKTALGRGTVYFTPYLSEKLKAKSEKLKKIKDEGEAGHLIAQEVQKDNRDFIEKKLKIKFDKWVSEEDFYEKSKIKKIFEWLKKKNLVYKKEDAWWIKTSQFGDERDWVIIRETGEPTYLLSDIAYHKDKFDRGFQKIINIWGADHQAHVSKIKAVAKMLGYKGSLDILILQLVTLRGKEKISKRRGEIITLEDLINEIGLDVARFLYLQKSLDTHMEIDLALAKEQSEKNPVYYVQYAHARICAMLRKSGKSQISNPNFQLLSHPSELNLIKQLIRFPEMVEDTAKDYQIQRLPQYALDLATAFHQFYRDCKVLSDDKNLTQARLSLVLATKTVLKNSLALMGISAPERM